MQPMASACLASASTSPAGGGAIARPLGAIADLGELEQDLHPLGLAQRLRVVGAAPRQRVGLGVGEQAQAALGGPQTGARGGLGVAGQRRVVGEVGRRRLVGLAAGLQHPHDALVHQPPARLGEVGVHHLPHDVVRERVAGAAPAGGAAHGGQERVALERLQRRQQARLVDARRGRRADRCRSRVPITAAPAQHVGGVGRQTLDAVAHQAAQR